VKTLAGIRGVDVVIEDLGDDAKALGLDEETGTLPFASEPQPF
jgi:hypothetical protein